MIRVRVRTPLRATEDVDRVRGAVLAMFPDATVHTLTDCVEAETTSLDRLRELIRAQRIPDTARGVMLRRLSNDTRRTTFLLGKQAAAVGRADFGAAGSPLGQLEILIDSDEDGAIERAVYWAAPDTTVPREWAEVPLSQRPAGWDATAGDGDEIAAPIADLPEGDGDVQDDADDDVGAADDEPDA